MKILQNVAVAGSLILASSVLSSAVAQSDNGIAVANAWSRATPAGAKTAVVYMTLVNRGATADRLVGETTPVGDKVAFHSSVNNNGIMRMREMPAVDLAPGARVALKPGGMHAMIEGLKQPLKEGQIFPLTFEFEKAGEINVMAPVGKIGAMQHENMQGM